MGVGVGVLEVVVPPSGGTTTPLEGPVPPAGGPTPSLELATHGSSPGVRTAPLARTRPSGWCRCSRAAPWVLFVTSPLPVRADTNPVPDEPIAVVVLFLGAMAMKNS